VLCMRLFSASPVKTFTAPSMHRTYYDRSIQQSTFPYGRFACIFIVDINRRFGKTHKCLADWQVYERRHDKTMVDHIQQEYIALLSLTVPPVVLSGQCSVKMNMASKSN
jgi:hypothetical protein